ncbi:hypothetical protein PMAYCL1PPCAC_02509 [Pristionchus mayeri]|uniref:E3 SUMO-protein ligase NSE2 n=1 Tax=Pristionchus mayeri TaxID=1317129 RepID=A0AAN5C805_9BILA|nr:hypothetical protein PMAYCL1PPCAC_02509 [Pristionchus mayeri]
MDLTYRNLGEVHNNMRRVIEGLNDLPVTKENQQEILALLEEMEKEDIDLVRRRQAYEELSEKEEIGSTPEVVEEAVLVIMEDIESEGKFTEELKVLHERFEKGEVEEEEGEMEVVSTTYSKKDPITKEDIKDPVRNSRCGHVYDRESVNEYIQMNKKNRMAVYHCPVQGCKNKVNLNLQDMVDFSEFFKLCK